MPMMTLSFTTSGAPVIEYPFFGSSTGTSQITSPVFRSSATRCASSVPIYNRSPRSPNPRFTMPQHTAIAPDRTPCPRVERPGCVEVSGDVHHAVQNERRRLPPASGCRQLGLEQPLQPEVGDVL